MADWAEDPFKLVAEENRAEVHGTSFEATTGAAARAAIIAACPYKKGGTFPGNSNLIQTEHPRIIGDIGMREVICYFEPISTGDSGTNDPGSGGPEDPLLVPPKILWGRITEHVPTDIDIEGRAIRNTAGDLYSPKLTRPVRARTLSITKNLTLYPFSLAETFENSINEHPVTANLPNGATMQFPAGSMAFDDITAPEYSADAPYIPCTLQLTIRLRGRYPFWLRAVNQGRNGFYTESGVTKYGRITNQDGNAVSDDVLLDETGKPKDTSLKVEGKTPVSNPNVVGGWTTDPDAPGPAVVQLWRMSYFANFTDLLTQFGLT